MAPLPLKLTIKGMGWVTFYVPPVSGHSAQTISGELSVRDFDFVGV